MKVAIRTIRIPVNVIKTGYVLCVDDYFGEVILVNNDSVKVKYPDESEEIIDINVAKQCVAKFLAQTPDLRTYPIIHNDFYKIMWQFDTKEKCRQFLKNKATVEGNFKNIPCMPKKDDVIEIINVGITDLYKMNNKHDRLGIIVKPLSKYKYDVKFADKTVPLSRSDFKIISSDDSKQVFALKD